MPRKESWVWSFATKSENAESVTCDLCGSSFAYDGSPSTIGKHLKNKHNLTSSTSSSNSSFDGSSTSVDSPGPSEPQSTGGQQTRKKRPRSAARECSPDQQEEITLALARMVAESQLPISFSESDGFKNLMKVSVPDYKPPSAKTVLARLNVTYNEVRAKIEKKMEDVEFVSCTTDCWTSVSQDSYISITAHYLDKEWTLCSHTLCTVGWEERHFSENLAIALEMAFSEWSIESKVTAVIHDNAADISLGVRFLDGVESVYCSAHTLQLCVKDFFDDYPGLKAVIQKGRSIVNFFRSSTVASKALEKTQRQLNIREEKLMQSCPTRWDSTYHMSERLVKNRSAVQAVIGDRTVTTLKTARRLQTTEEEWEILSALVTVLKPFQVSTTLLCAENKVTISLVRPIIHGIIENHLKVYQDQAVDDVMGINMAETLKDTLIKRFKMYDDEADPEVLTVNEFACFLDPRCKTLSHETSESKKTAIRNFVKSKMSVVEEESASTSTSTGTAETGLDFIFKTKTREVSDSETQFTKYCAEPEVGHNTDVLKWWRDNEPRFPAIAQVAKKYLGIPSTSASSERAFSAAGNIVSKKRNCLSVQNVNLLVFLSQNKKLL